MKATLRQIAQPLKLANNQRLFLGSRPTFDLPLRCDGIGNGAEMLRE
jgi:hypothetical protein